MIGKQDIDRVIAAATKLEADGYFEKVRQGDQRAASLFARLTAHTLNPHGRKDDFGCLSKTPGEQHVDGFAEDAIVLGSDEADRKNVIDIVNSAGAPGASINTGREDRAKERRENNRWVKPAKLSAEDLAYLQSGGAAPVERPRHQVALPGREEMMQEGIELDRWYSSPEGLKREHGLTKDGRPDWEGIGAWLYDVYLAERLAGKERLEARLAMQSAIKSTDEWRGKHPGEV